MPGRGFPIVAALFVAALLASFGCGGGSDSGGGVIPLVYSCGDAGSPGANTVELRCGGSSGATGVPVKVVIGGPSMGTTSVDGLNFDVTYDPAKLYFVSASGSAAPPFSNALVAAALANGQQGRVVVSIQQPGAVDAMVSPGEHTILTLTFRAVTGVTFGPTSLAFDNAEATNASTAISFVDGLQLAYQ